MPVINVPMVNMPTMFVVTKSDGSRREFKTMEEAQAWLNESPLNVLPWELVDQPVVVEGK